MKAQAVHLEIKCPEGLKMYRLASRCRASSGTFRRKMSRKTENVPPDRQIQNIRRYDTVKTIALKSAGNML